MDVPQTMQFIRAQQALSNLWANRLTLAQLATKHRMSRLDAAMTMLAETPRMSHVESDARLDEIEASVKAASECIARLGKKIDALVERAR